jgi:hypothetical protein
MPPAIKKKKTILESLLDQTAEILDVETQESKLVDPELERCRQLCRDGNPFPLAAYQWPEMIVRDESEQELFRFTPLDKLTLVPPHLVERITNPEDPVLRLDWWQRLVLAAFFDASIGEIYIKGCTGAGKGASTSMGTCLWYDVNDVAKIALSGRDRMHALATIFGETKSFFMKMKSPANGRILGESITESEMHYIKVLNPDPSSPTAGEAFSGAHGPGTLTLFDEATVHPDAFFENAERNSRKVIALANPRTLFGRFRSAFKPLGPNIDKIGVVPGPLGNRLLVTVDGLDCMNVRHKRLKKPVAPIGGIEIDGVQYAEGSLIPKDAHAKAAPLIPSQMDLQQFMGAKSMPNQNLVNVFAHGKFPIEDASKQVILASWLDRHVAAWEATKDSLPVECFSFDVSRSTDGDSSCLGVGGIKGCKALIEWQSADLTFHCDEIERHALGYGVNLRLGRNPIVVDCDGIGAGVADILASRGVWVIEFKGNVPIRVDPRRYANQRAEAYGVVGRRLDPGDQWGSEAWAIPQNQKLLEELVAPEKVYPPSDAFRFHITPKVSPPGRDDVVSIRKKLGRSPDRADSLVYLFHGVREFHAMNDFFAQYSRPLTVWPAPETDKEKAIAESPIRGKPLDEDILSLDFGTKAAATKDDKVNSLLAYLQEEYGR